MSYIHVAFRVQVKAGTTHQQVRKAVGESLFDAGLHEYEVTFPLAESLDLSGSSMRGPCLQSLQNMHEAGLLDGEAWVLGMYGYNPPVGWRRRYDDHECVYHAEGIKPHDMRRLLTAP